MGKLEAIVTEIDGPEVDPDADFSLPGWIYHDREFFDLELERIFRPSWQIVCHVNEVAGPGDYRTLDYLGESVIVIRGDDGQVRAFTNVCRHRAMRLVEGPSGCAKKLVCPYHAWAYELEAVSDHEQLGLRLGKGRCGLGALRRFQTLCTRGLRD